MHDQAASDPFPTTALGTLVGRLPRYARLGWRLGRDDRLSRGRRAVVLAAAAYLASPIDLVPGIIPVAGQLDDAAVGLLALRLVLRGLSPPAQAAHLEAVGLATDDIDRDLATVRHTAGWIVRRGARLSVRAARAGASATFTGARGLARLALAGISRARR